MVLSGKLQKLIRTESLPPLVGSLCAAMNARIYDVTGIFIRKWLEQHVVDDAENRRAGANAKRKSYDRHGGEAGIAPELAKCIAQVFEKVREKVGSTVSRHHWLSRRLAYHPESPFGRQVLGIQLHQHIAAGFLVRRAARDQILVTVLEVLRQLLNNLDLAG